MSLVGLIGAEKSFSVADFVGGQQLVAKKPFSEGEVLGYAKGSASTAPDMHSIQLVARY